MKRLFIVASLAIAAIGCQKTEVQNEVLTPIGFNTEIGKQTRAINNTNEATDNFGVFSYLYDVPATGAAVATKVMDNQEVSAAGSTKEGVASAKTYYWPNDLDNHLNFYAYSPYNVGTVAMTTEGTLTLTSYTHENYYGDHAVDFMVATPAKEQKYSTNSGKVAVEFHHEMTQVQFTAVSTSTDQSVSVVLNSIAFDGAVKTASYNNTSSASFATGSWTTANNYNKEDVIAFPLDGQEAQTLSSTVFESTALTMIPITPTSITVVYTVTANSVAEVVEQTMTLANSTQWAANKKIIYKLSIGLNEISFEPSVESWGNGNNNNVEVPFTPDPAASN